MSVRSSSQMMARQPRAAPTRSAPYSTPIAPRVRVRARLTTSPDRTKGSRQDERRNGQRGKFGHRAAAHGGKWDDEIRHVRNGEHQRERNRGHWQEAPRARRREQGPAQENQHRACRHPQHGHRHRQEREVIPGQHRQKAGIEHLQHQRGERHKEKTRGEPDPRGCEVVSRQDRRVYHPPRRDWPISGSAWRRRSRL